MTQDPLLKNLRESVARLSHQPLRSTPQPGRREPSVQDSIQRMSRARVSQILRQLRETLGLTYGQVQEASGLSQQLLFDVEFAERRLTLTELHSLAKCYNTDVAAILGVDID